MADQSVNLRAGLHNVGSYQVSGIPFASSSIVAPTGSGTPLEITFPSVTKFVLVKNNNSTSASLRVGFSANGVKNGKNYITLAKDESFCGDLKLTSIFLLGDSAAVTCSVVAGLTGITGYDLTTAYSGSSGVG
jgi:hypothetical protein